VYAVGAALPATRLAFLDARYHLDAGSALVTALLVIPIGTVLLEEIAFRGVLHGLVRHHHGTLWATGLSSILFGLWHILPSLRLSGANQAAATFFGAGAWAQVAAVSAAHPA
jgi:membrane protease YdiL (CAAX protease family)